LNDSEARFSHRRVLKYRGGSFRETETPVIDEVPVTVTLNGREIITFLASDDGLDYLAVGFLKSEGFIEEKEDVLSIRIDSSRSKVDVETSRSDPLAEKLLEHRTVTSGCGKGTTFYHALDALLVKPVPPGPVVGADQVQRLMNLLHRNAALYRIAGGVHNAALCDAEGIILFRDDIGRHNAIDKIHGECFLKGIDVGDKLLLTTGRISSEILIKAGKLGVPILVSRSSPTGLALDLAERTGITVIALVRGGGLSVYSHPERVRREETPP
jgi:FdhD protein